MTPLVVLKFGGELLEDDARTKAAARLVARAARRVRLIVVHGGGREIDAALAQASIPKQQVDGLRITDAPTLDVVVRVLAGSINTRFVAAINAAGGRAVGLTGADAGVGAVRRARAHRAIDGRRVDLGLVGEPVADGGAPLLALLARQGFVPVIACIGASARGELFNVNADTLAGSVAARVKAARLIIAGATAGVLDRDGATLRRLDRAGIDALVRSGTATAGMIAKLRACAQARDAGVKQVTIADGRSPRLAALIGGAGNGSGPWTTLA